MPEGKQTILYVGGGELQPDGTRTFPFSFHVTTADFVVYPGNGSKLKTTSVPTKSRHTLERAEGASKLSTTIPGHCSE
jgi:hypothetical protein